MIPCQKHPWASQIADTTFLPASHISLSYASNNLRLMEDKNVEKLYTLFKTPEHLPVDFIYVQQ